MTDNTDHHSGITREQHVVWYILVDKHVLNPETHGYVSSHMYAVRVVKANEPVVRYQLCPLLVWSLLPRQYVE